MGYSVSIDGGMEGLSAFDGNGRRKYLNAAENERFLAATSKVGAEMEAFSLFLYYTGCRISEALALRFDDIQLEEGIVAIRTLKRRRKKVVRRIPIPALLLEKLKVVDASEDRIWTCSRTTAWRWIRRVMALANVAGAQASPKGLRHGFGVRAVLNDVPLNKIKTWMGHAKLSNTEIYLDVQDEEERTLMTRTWSRQSSAESQIVDDR